MGRIVSSTVDQRRSVPRQLPPIAVVIAATPKMPSCARSGLMYRNIRMRPSSFLLVDFGFNETGEVSQRVLPTQIAHLRRNDVGNAFLQDVELGTAGDCLESYRHLHFARQIGVVEFVGVAQPLAGHELHVISAERMTLA